MSSFIGGCFQYNAGPKIVNLHGTNARENIFQGVYFENPTATGSPYALYCDTSSDHTTVTGCHFSSTADNIYVASNSNQILYPAQFQGTLTNVGLGNAFLGRFDPGTIVDTGSQTSLADPYALTQVGRCCLLYTSPSPRDS